MLAKATVLALALCAATAVATNPFPMEALDEYVQDGDPTFSWVDTGLELHGHTGRFNNDKQAWTGRYLNITTQSWLTEEDSSQPVWWHLALYMTPDDEAYRRPVAPDAKTPIIMYITGYHNGQIPSATDEVSTGSDGMFSCVALLLQGPGKKKRRGERERESGRESGRDRDTHTHKGLQLSQDALSVGRGRGQHGLITFVSLCDRFSLLLSIFFLTGGVGGGRVLRGHGPADGDAVPGAQRAHRVPFGSPAEEPLGGRHHRLHVGPFPERHGACLLACHARGAEEPACDRRR